MKFDVNKQVESRLNLKPSKDTFGLALAELESVEVKDYEVPVTDEKGSETKSEFKGLTVPRINLTWRNHKVKEGEEDRYHTLSFGPIVSVKNDGSPMDAKTLSSIYENMFAALMHAHNCYKGSVNYIAIKSLPDIDETATAAARVEQTRAFFKAFEKAFNGTDGKAVYKNTEGKNIPVWLKLVADYKTQSHYETPNFVGQGWTEVAIQTTINNKVVWKQPLIELKPNESIDLIPKTSKKPSNVNIATDQMASNSSDVDDLISKYVK